LFGIPPFKAQNEFIFQKFGWYDPVGRPLATFTAWTPKFLGWLRHCTKN